MRTLTDIIYVSESFHLHHENKSGEESFQRAERIMKWNMKLPAMLNNNKKLTIFFWQGKKGTKEFKGSRYECEESIEMCRMELHGNMLAQNFCIYRFESIKKGPHEIACMNDVIYE